MRISTLKPGYIVTVFTDLPLKLKAYVGEIQEVDDTGIRITLADWIIGSFTGDDLFITWPHVIGAAVGTPDHTAFDPAKWQDLAEDFAKGEENGR